MKFGIALTCIIAVGILVAIILHSRRKTLNNQEARKVPYSDFTKEYINIRWDEVFGSKSDENKK